MPLRRMFNEAQALHQRGKLVEARQRYEHILRKEPQSSLVRLFLSIIQFDAGQVHEAEDNARRAMREAKQPDASMWTNFGVMLKNCGDLDGSRKAYEEALKLDPSFLPAKSNLATLLYVSGYGQAAETIFLEMTEKLEEVAPWLNLARIALEREDWTKAQEYLERAEDINPIDADLQMLRGRLAAKMHDNASAFTALQKVLQKQPAHRETWLSLQMLDASALDVHKVEEAALALVACKTESAATLAAAVNLCRQNMLWEPLEALEAMLAKALQLPFESVPSASAVFTLLGANVPQKAQLAAARALWQKISAHIKPFEMGSLVPRSACQKIKVAFLSSDLRSHAIGFLMAGLLENLPKTHISWFAYNNSFSDTSSSRDRIRSSFDRFINVSSLSIEELAHKIYDDEIDILIDLNAMTKDTMVAVMGLRPAPIQINWMGMPGSVGAGENIDYIIGDSNVIDENNADGFDECLMHLPGCFFPNDHVPPDLSLAGTRTDHHLPEAAFVFCSFNQQYKMSPDTIALWGQILAAVPNSVLWILKPLTESLQKRWQNVLAGYSIANERLIFADHKPQAEHIARISHADLVLDNWPYNAFTTCCDALRAGTPVLTLPKYPSFASRGGMTILKSANLSQWIATSPEEYVQKAIAYASLPRTEIETIKSETKASYWSSSMVDNACFANMLESLCLALYDRAASGLAPTSMALDEDGKLHPLPFGRQG